MSLTSRLFNEIRYRFHPLYRLRKVDLYRKLQHFVDPDVAISVQGFKVYVKLLRDLGLILSREGQEEKVMGIVSSLLSSTQFDVFIDVGANVGFYSWLAKKHRVSDIFMFEPDQANIRLLMRTLRANHFQNVFLVPFAASALAGVENFFPDHASGTTGSLSLNPHSLHAAYGVSGAIAVPTLPLDTFAGFCCNKRVLIKIDVEGAETAVFDGARGFIEQVKPLMIVECFDISRLHVLRTLGYSAHALDDKGNYLLQPPGFVMPF